MSTPTPPAQAATPRTAAELLTVEGNNRAKVYADFARTLERELTAARAQVEEMKAALAREKSQRAWRETERRAEYDAKVTDLTAEVERLRKTNEEIGRMYGYASDGLTSLKTQLTAERTRSAKLVEALEYYADKTHWDDNTTASSGGEDECKVYTSNHCIFFDNADGWEKAIAALADSRSSAVEPGAFKPSHGARDHTEDFSNENGNYQSTCHGCGLPFIGHKRRIYCKTCSTPNFEPSAVEVKP